MAFISVKNLSVEFKIYGANSQSFKSQLLRQAIGSRISNNIDDSIIVKALDDISIEFKEGDRIGLVGHNGAGKSTFLRTLSGIYKPVQGSIDYQGKLGVLLDMSLGMDPESTGFENIYLRGYLLGMRKKEIDSKINTIAKFTELGDFLKLPIRTYSKGMLSRLSYSISTSINPEILLMDEGIGVGDKHFLKKIQRKTIEMWDNANIAILASHDTKILRMFANKLIYFEKGKIIGEKKLKAKK